MRYLRTFSTCLVALALHSAAWAEIYETTDAQGNREFTDSPADEGAQECSSPLDGLGRTGPATTSSQT